MRCHCVPIGPLIFISIWVINKWQSGTDFFLVASAQYNSSCMNKISVPSPVFRAENTLMKAVYKKTLECQQGEVQ